MYWGYFFNTKWPVHRPGTVFILRFHMMRNRWSVSKIKGKEVWSMTKVIMMGSQDPGNQLHISLSPSCSLFCICCLFFCFCFFKGWSWDICLFSLRQDSHQINLWYCRRITPILQLLVHAEMGKSCRKGSHKRPSACWWSQTNIKLIAQFFSQYWSTIIYV